MKKHIAYICAVLLGTAPSLFALDEAHFCSGAERIAMLATTPDDASDHFTLLTFLQKAACYASSPQQLGALTRVSNIANKIWSQPEHNELQKLISTFFKHFILLKKPQEHAHALRRLTSELFQMHELHPFALPRTTMTTFLTDLQSIFVPRKKRWLTVSGVATVAATLATAALLYKLISTANRGLKKLDDKKGNLKKDILTWAHNAARDEMKQTVRRHARQAGRAAERAVEGIYTPLPGLGYFGWFTRVLTRLALPLAHQDVRDAASDMHSSHDSLPYRDSGDSKIDRTTGDGNAL